MTTIVFELVIDFDSQYTPAKPAVLNPPPGEPPEAEEIEIGTVNLVRVDGYDLKLDDGEKCALIDHLMEVKSIRETIEEAIREDASD